MNEGLFSGLAIVNITFAAKARSRVGLHDMMVNGCASIMKGEDMKYLTGVVFC